jgi:pyridoxamine 5'-phosphate oxidase
MLSDAENDAYFRTRAWQKQVGAWASQQSQSVESREALAAAVAREARRFGIPYAGPGSAEPDEISVTVPRPPNWGGYRLYVDALELWVEGEYRIHDRARWTRALVEGRSDPAAAWTATRLQP